MLCQRTYHLVRACNKEQGKDCQETGLALIQ